MRPTLVVDLETDSELPLALNIQVGRELSGGALPVYVRPWVPSPAPQNETKATVIWNMFRSTFESVCRKYGFSNRVEKDR